MGTLLSGDDVRKEEDSHSFALQSGVFPNPPLMWLEKH